jgi:hypothetical protein
MRFLFVILFFSLAGCASQPGTWRQPANFDGNPNPAAYAGDAMYFSKDQPHRPDPKPWEFYYKHCAMNGDETYYSATSYDCSGPSF